MVALSMFFASIWGKIDQHLRPNLHYGEINNVFLFDIGRIHLCLAVIYY